MDRPQENPETTPRQVLPNYHAHEPSEFESISEAGGLLIGDRKALIEIQWLWAIHLKLQW